MSHVKFDLDKALNRETYAYNCWVEKTYNNSTKISDKDLRIIEDH